MPDIALHGAKAPRVARLFSPELQPSGRMISQPIKQQPSSAQDQQTVYRELGKALFAGVPDDGTQIELFVEVESVDRPRLEISGSSKEPLLKTPDDSLYPAVYRFIDLRRESDRHLKSADYRLFWDDSNEDWQMSVDLQW